jgi:hypothetical protein
MPRPQVQIYSFKNNAQVEACREPKESTEKPRRVDEKILLQDQTITYD